MPFRVFVRVTLVALLFMALVRSLPAQRSANANTDYQQLRGLLPSGEVAKVENLELRRDAAAFTFRHGQVTFYPAVDGKVTGAVFRGEGHLHIVPPTPAERHGLSLFAHAEEFDEDFDQVVLRFSDDTAAELHKASAGKGDADGAFVKAAADLQNFARHHLNQNLDLRLLQDVLSPAQGGYFAAAIHGRKYPHLFFVLDPLGVSGLAPEEEALMNWAEGTLTYPLAFHRTAEYLAKTASGSERNAAYRIAGEDLDVSIEKGGFLSSLATVEIRAEKDGLAVVPLDLFATLRVSKVEDAKGGPLDWVQENKDEDPDLGIILARPLKRGEAASLRITYGGKDVVLKTGNGNYYPVAREDWFPNSGQGLGDYADYRMRFHVPKGLQIVATGKKVSEVTDGRITTSEWKTVVPLPVVGFSLGDFEMKESRIGNPLKDDLTIDVYANKQLPDAFAGLAAANDAPVAFPGERDAQSAPLGNLKPTAMLANEMAQGQAAAKIYTSYFGELPFAQISLTQQSACNYGQSWPMLVYLPVCGFFDDTQKHFLGMGGENLSRHMYWTVVTPHEVAHQWWGQTVGFRSYRDQWMSEGFADASAAIFLQATRNSNKDYREFWRQERQMLSEKNQWGFRAVDVGPLTMGFRLSSPKTGWNVYDNLVYPKGAYILHMIRMMMWSPQQQDGAFRAMMQDFVDTYRLKAATTEDFKAMVEKHMTPQMDLDGNHRMDWFFNEYVYGTDLPAYHLDSQVLQNGDVASVHLKLVQSGVPASFEMMVPVYVELANGSVLRLGLIKMSGSKAVEKTITLPKLPSPVKGAVVNYNYDVLSVDN